MRYDVSRIALSPSGWGVEARVTNTSGMPLEVTRPHRRGATMFGLVVSRTAALPRSGELRDLRTPFYAESAKPAVPAVLEPGQAWTGSFSGHGRFPRRRYLRVVFGRFSPAGRPAEGFLVVTAQAVRLAR